MRYLHYVPAHDDAARLTAAFTPENPDGGIMSNTPEGVAHFQLNDERIEAWMEQHPDATHDEIVEVLKLREYHLHRDDD